MRTAWAVCSDRPPTALLNFTLLLLLLRAIALLSTRYSPQQHHHHHHSTLKHPCVRDTHRARCICRRAASRATLLSSAASSAAPSTPTPTPTPTPTDLRPRGGLSRGLPAASSLDPAPTLQAISTSTSPSHHPIARPSKAPLQCTGTSSPTTLAAPLLRLPRLLPLNPLSLSTVTPHRHHGLLAYIPPSLARCLLP